jgi:hypothetical protein
MSRAQRFAFTLVTLAILVAIFRVSLQLPRLRTDSPSADWTLDPVSTKWPAYPIPTDSSYKSDHISDPPQSHSPSKAIQTILPSKAPESGSHFISWLSTRVPVDHVPFVTIGDGKYVHALRNFRDRLDQWGYGEDFVVICLDQCCADARGYHAYPHFIGESVAFIKVRYFDHC